MAGDKTILKLALITLAVFCLGHPRLSLAGQPIDQIKRTVDHVTRVLQENGANPNASKADTVEKIRRVLLPQFDFTEMAKRSLGSHWRSLNGRENEFVGAFTALVESAYMGTLEAYRGEKVLYLRERVEQEFAQVDTQIVPVRGDAISVVYWLHLVDGQWKVYDVVVENISLINNYRSQFNRILASASVDDLLKKLRAKGSGKPV
jgi:phospholipid transport system substrate-binding protein